MRWLVRLTAAKEILRLLRDDENLLRLPEEDGDTVPFSFLHGFDRLVADAGDDGAAEQAAALLRAELAIEHATLPFDALARLHQYLQRDETRPVARVEARSHGLPELFGVTKEPSPRARGSREGFGHIELHAHLRGSVPFMALWATWLRDHRRRRSLAKLTIEEAGWRTTFGDLVAAAEGARPWPVDQLDGTSANRRRESARLRCLGRVLGASTGVPNSKICIYVQICGLLRRHLLYQRKHSGLVGFAKAYDQYAKAQKRTGTTTRGDTAELVEIVAERFAADGTVALELRPTFERTPRALARRLRDAILGYLRFLKTGAPLTLGLVLSLYKQEKASNHEERRRIWQEQVEALLELLDRNPAFRWFVAGVDAAGCERGCPPWMLLPAIDRVRRYNQARGVGGERPGTVLDVVNLKERLATATPEDLFDALNAEDAPWFRLGVTVHAGEDFADPMTGLRHLWEAVCHLDMRRGDRVGHAIAASLVRERLTDLLDRRCREPKSRYRRGSPALVTRPAVVSGACDIGPVLVHKPRGEHLADLAWELEVGGPHEAEACKARLGAAAARCWDSLEDVPALARQLSPRALITGRIEIPGVFFDDPDVNRDAVGEWVRLDNDWLARFERRRKRVLQEIATRGVVIESCPTSNRVVANMARAPIHDLLAEKYPLRVVIASDDPGLLGAWPSDEFGELGSDDAERHRARLVAEAERASFCRATDGARGSARK